MGSPGFSAIKRSNSRQSQPDWYERESEHFLVIYREPHAYLAPHIVESAEKALERLMEIFDYTPSEKIIIATFDLSDYGTAGAISVPHNLEDVRAGLLTVSPKTHELWGVRHHLGKVSLVYSVFPYRALISVIEFEYGDVLQHLAVSPTGKYLAATLHRPGGEQEVIVVDVERFKKNGIGKQHFL